MAQTIQEQLIGAHPKGPHIFGLWWHSTDLPATDRKKHRQLSEESAAHDAAIEQLAKWIIEYHITDLNMELLEKQKAILDKNGLGEYIDKLHLLPQTDNTQKGNLGEIILIEYLKASKGYTPLIYKLHYNPNPDQSMKGDDVLMFNPDDINKEVIYGECKFRGQPSAEVVGEIVGNLEGLKQLPISLNFVANRIGEQGNKALAEQIIELQLKLFNGEVPLTNVGFLVSKNSQRAGHGTSAIVENNLDTNNPRLVMLSLGVEKPDEIVTKAFEKAFEILKSK